MGTHVLVADHDTALGVMFKCSICDAVCEFQHEPMTPSPVWDVVTSSWLPPENPEEWMGPCNQ